MENNFQNGQPHPELIAILHNRKNRAIPIQHFTAFSHEL